MGGQRSRVCIVLSIEPGTWKDSGRPLSLIWIYLNDWVKYFPCFLNAWIYGCPWSWYRESWLCHPSREGFTQCLKECLDQWFFSQYCQCSNAWVNCPYISGCLWQTSAGWCCSAIPTSCYILNVLVIVDVWVVRHNLVVIWSCTVLHTVLQSN